MIPHRALALLLWPALLASPGSADEVLAADALAIADLVYRMELEGGRVTLAEGELEERRARLAERRVRFVDVAGELRGEAPADGGAWIYAVTYEPSGWVMVSGRDQLSPVLAFGFESELEWGTRELDFMRHQVDTCIGNARVHADAPRNPLWDALLERARDPRAGAAPSPSDAPGGPGDSGPGDGPGAGGGTNHTLHVTAPWAQGGFYNDTVVAMNGGTEVPVGCTATAMAIAMQHFQWPLTGSGSHCYTDSSGSVQGLHCANFGAHVYDWDAMPAEAVTAANDDVADLMYHCAVAVDMNFEAAGSGAWPSASAMNTYFRYDGTVEFSSGHAAALKESVLAGLVVVCSSSAHTIVVDGYRDDVAPFFHMNVGWGSTHGWYDIDAGFPASDKSINRSYPYGAPENHGYVDASSPSLWAVGTVSLPYDSIVTAESSIPSDGEMFIMEGTYNESVVFDRAMMIRPYSTTSSTPGPVLIQGDQDDQGDDEINWYTDYDQALAAAQAQNKLLFMDFWADWCGPCLAMEADTYPDPQVIAELSSHFINCKIDVDLQPALTQQFGVGGIPAMFILEPDGTIVDERTGGMNAQSFLAWVQGVWGAHHP